MDYQNDEKINMISLLDLDQSECGSSSGFTISQMRDEILQVTVRLYLAATSPYAIVDKKTGEIVEQGSRWVNEEAKQTYSRCQEILKEIESKEAGIKEAN